MKKKGPKRPKRQCRVDCCKNTLSNVSNYHVRYKVCPLHASMASVEVDGETVRFCQRHGTFHPLDEFEGDQKTCRKQLGVHNERRKKKRAVTMEIRAPTPAAQQSSDRDSARLASVSAAPVLPSPVEPSGASTGDILVAWMAGQGRSQLAMAPLAVSGMVPAPLVRPGLPPGLNELTLPGATVHIANVDVEVDSALMAAPPAAAAPLPPLGPPSRHVVSIQHKLVMASFKLFNAHPSQLPREVYNKLWEMVVVPRAPATGVV